MKLIGESKEKRLLVKLKNRWEVIEQGCRCASHENVRR